MITPKPWNLLLSFWVFASYDIQYHTSDSKTYRVRVWGMVLAACQHEVTCAMTHLMLSASHRRSVITKYLGNIKIL